MDLGSTANGNPICQELLWSNRQLRKKVKWSYKWLIPCAANGRKFLWIYYFVCRGIGPPHQPFALKMHSQSSESTFADVPLDYYRMHAIDISLARRQHRTTRQIDHHTAVALMVRTFPFGNTQRPNTKKHTQSKSNANSARHRSEAMSMVCPSDLTEWSSAIILNANK